MPTDKLTRVPTFTATIWLGLREGYSGRLHCLAEAQNICQDYVNRVGLCVTVSPTEFVYKDGCEPGVEIGLICYPRFASRPAAIEAQAMELAGILKAAFKQDRVSVVMPHETVMLGET